MTARRSAPRVSKVVRAKIGPRPVESVFTTLEQLPTTDLRRLHGLMRERRGATYEP